MLKVLFCLILICCIGCSGNAPENITEVEKVISAVALPDGYINLEENNVIKLTNMDSNGLYSIYRQGSAASSKGIGSLTASATGTFLPQADENGECIFTASDLKMSKGKFKIAKLEVDTASDMTIHEETDNYVDYNGGKLYEEFYKFHLKKQGDGFDPARVVILQDGTGSGRKSSDYGIFENGFKLMGSDNNSHGIIDLSKQEVLNIYNTMLVSYSSEPEPFTQSISLRTPVELKYGESIAIPSLQCVFQIPASVDPDTEYVVEISDFGKSLNFHMVTNNISPRLNDGKHREVFLPLTGNRAKTHVFYIGKVSELFIFNSTISRFDDTVTNFGAIKIREATEAEKPQIITMTEEPVTVNVYFASGEENTVKHGFLFSSEDDKLLMDVKMSFRLYDVSNNLITVEDDSRLQATLNSPDSPLTIGNRVVDYSKTMVIDNGMKLESITIMKGKISTAARAEIIVEQL